MGHLPLRDDMPMSLGGSGPEGEQREESPAAAHARALSWLAIYGH